MVSPSEFKIITKTRSLAAKGPAAVVCACGLVLVETIVAVGIVYRGIQLQDSLLKDKKE